VIKKLLKVFPVLCVVILSGIVVAANVLSASAQSKDSAKNQSKLVQTKTNKADRLFAEYIRINHELKRLSKELRSPERIESQIRLISPDKDPSAYFKELQKRRKALQKELDQVLLKFPLPIRGDYELMERRPFRISDGVMRTRESSLQDLIQALKPKCPNLSIGQVQASGFRQYNWSHTEGGYGEIIFWPLSDSLSQIPSNTFTGDWSGETGAQFFGQLITSSNPGIDKHQHIAAAGILQFTLPAPDCASVIYWGTTGRVRKEGPWTFNSDWGVIQSQWVLREDPTGGGFPAYLMPNFILFADGLYGESDEPESIWKPYDSQNFNRSFRVNAGVESKIYLGISLWIEGKGDGKVMTAFFETLNFDYGITYFMVPE
jgi:hypothetical protein